MKFYTIGVEEVATALNHCCKSGLGSSTIYMSFDKFLLAVESRDLSQADKSIRRVPSFPKLSDG